MTPEQVRTVRKVHKAIQALCRELQGTGITQQEVLPYAQAIEKLYGIIEKMEGPTIVVGETP